MSHHFDTATALEDPRINVCDYYLFAGRPGTTVVAMTVNPDAGISGPDTFHDEGLYAFRFDLNGDGREEVAFKVKFGEVRHADGNEHKHVQMFEVRRSTGPAAILGFGGEVIASGRTDEVVKAASGTMVFAGLAPDLFAGDAVAINNFKEALFKRNEFDPDAFKNRTNFFARRNVSAIVIELPNHLIGEGKVYGWATASLHGHAPEVQVSRWGIPMLTHVFMPDANVREDYNRSPPVDDIARFSETIGAVAEKLTGLAGSAARPADYAKQLVDRLCPTNLPYVLGSPAAFDFAGFNGRALQDDAMDVILTLATNTALGDGVAPPTDRVREEFPYFGVPFSAAEQVGVVSATGHAKK